MTQIVILGALLQSETDNYITEIGAADEPFSILVSIAYYPPSEELVVKVNDRQCHSRVHLIVATQLRQQHMQTYGNECILFAVHFARLVLFTWSTYECYA